MKSIAMIALVITLPFIKANSQITKGNWMVGGSVSYSSTNNGFSTPSYTQYSFQATPNVGYFFLDKLTGGIRLNYVTAGATYYNAGHQYTLEIGPFVRYYLLPTEKMVNIFTGLSYSHFTEDNTVFKYNTLEFSAGPVLYLNSSVGFEAILSYAIQNANTYTNTRNTIQFGFGLQIHLKKDK